MSNEINELAREIHSAPARIAWNGEQHVIADALHQKGYRKPRTITTIEEINSLTDGSFIESHNGQLGRTQRHTVSSLNGGGVHLDKLEMLPATVLHEPEAK